MKMPLFPWINRGINNDKNNINDKKLNNAVDYQANSYFRLW